MSAEDMFLLGVSVSYGGQIYVSEQEMIDTGRAVCNALDLGATGMDVALAMVDASAGDASTSEFLTAVTASAVANFCPEHAWKFM